MLDFLYTGVSWVLLRWHDLFTFLGLSAASGVNWSLSIIFLVITARLLLFRFFLKQVHYQRNMQEMQPRLQAIKEKYKNDPAGPATRDDAPATRGGIQSTRRLSADAAADPDLHLAVPRAEAPVQLGQPLPSERSSQPKAHAVLVHRDPDLRCRSGQTVRGAARGEHPGFPEQRSLTC